MPVQPVQPEVSEGTNPGMSYDDYLKWASLKNRTLYISEGINDTSASKVSRELDVLVDNGKNTEPITVIITCPGGIVLSALSIYDRLINLRKDHKIEINTIVSGYAASMASIILQAGSKRSAYRNSKILIHEISQFKFFSMENSSQLEEQLAETKKLEKILWDILSEKTNKSPEELKKLCYKKDVWFNAEEALEFGLIDEVLG